MVTALLIGFASALAVSAFFVGIYYVIERPGDLTARVEAYATIARQRGRREAEGRAASASLLKRLDEVVSGRAFAGRLRLRLAQADIHMTLLEFMGVLFAATVVGGVAGFALQMHLLSAGAGAVIGLAIPWLALERKRHQRLAAFRDQLIDVLVLIVGSLRSGHGLTNALDLVSKEMDPPAADEFARVLREVGFGLSLNQALENLVGRVESEDLDLVVTAININQEVGGNLTLVLEKIAATIRERIRLQGEVRVLTTQQRLTSYLLVGLPFFLGTILALMNPSWMMRLFKPGWIRIVPITAVFLEVVGFLITRRLIRIDV